jgi:cell division septation protein DedD
MKQADLKEKSSVFFIGKGIIVMILTGIASLSFLLGFFVGKISRTPEMNQQSAITDRGNAEESSPVSAEQQTLPQQSDPLQQAEEMQASYGAGQRDATKAVQTVSETPGVPQPQAPQQTNKLQKSGVNSQINKNQESKKSNEASETKKTDETNISDKTRKYTVQIGAFRNASDADALRSKLDKKGHRTFLIESKTKNNEPLYKIAAGAFTTRNEAELLAAKIKKSEGLKTFVTLR